MWSVLCTLRHFLFCICVILLFSHPRGSLPAECVFRTGSGRGTGLSSGTSRGRGHSDFGWAVLSWETILILNLFETLLQSAALNLFVSPCRTELGCDPERRQRRCPCQLLPQSKQTGVASVVKWAEFIIFVRNLNVSSCACVLDRSRWEWSLKPVPEHRRPQPPLGTRWSSPRPTWCFEVINLFFIFTYFILVSWSKRSEQTSDVILFVCLFLLHPGMINSRCIIGGVLEKRLTPLPATLIMGAFVNHRGDKLQVGLGVNVGWPSTSWDELSGHPSRDLPQIMIWMFRVPLLYQNTSGLSDASQPAAYLSQVTSSSGGGENCTEDMDVCLYSPKTSLKPVWNQSETDLKEA